MYWSSLGTTANPAAYQAANAATGYAVGHTPAAGTYTAQRAPSTYESAAAAGYPTATSHASASYATPSTTYEYGYTAQRPNPPVAAAAAAAAAVYDASKSYYTQPAAAAAAAAATAATSYTAGDTQYQAATPQRTSTAAAAKGSFSGAAYSSVAQPAYTNFPAAQAGKGPYAQANLGAATAAATGAAAVAAPVKAGGWATKKGPFAQDRSRRHYNNGSKAAPRPQQLHYCDVCKISCAGPQTYREHLEGQKHKKKEQSVKVGPTPSRLGASLRCELCDVTCTGADAYAAHIRGAKHQKVVKLHQKLGKPIPSDDPVLVGNKPSTATTATTSTATTAKASTSAGVKKEAEAGSSTASKEETLAELKEKDVEPVGMEYIELMEYTAHGERKVMSFNCKLCDCRFNDPNAKEMHMKGRRHRLQYKKKVNPSLQVEAKTSNKQRKIQEDKLRRFQNMMGPGFERRGPRFGDEEERMERRRMEEEMEYHDWFFPRPPMGPRPPFMPHMGPMMPIRHTSDDRHVMAKHQSIYPSEDQLAVVQRVVSHTEKALKLVSDQLAELDNPVKTEGTDGKSEDNGSRVLKGVMRVGILAKGLLLKEDENVRLVVLCAEKPSRSLLDRVADAMPQHLNTLSGDSATYSVIRIVEEAAVQVVHESLRVTVTLTSPVMRDPKAQEGQSGTGSQPKDAPDVLDKVKCLEALAALRHAKWFQARANGLQSCVVVIRILREFCQRNSQWSVLSSWALELMVEKVLASANGPLSPGDGLRRVFEAVSSGLLLPGSPGLYDPCEKEPTDAAGRLTSQEREEMTASAQHMLRCIAFRQVHSVLAMDPLPAPKFRGPQRFPRKRRRDDGAEAEGTEGKKEKKEEPSEVAMETK